METLFVEMKTLGQYLDRSGFDNQVNATIVAYFDRTLRVLVVDCAAHAGSAAPGWLPEVVRYLETIEDTEYPLRRILVQPG
jgi:hypothetical protein